MAQIRHIQQTHGRGCVVACLAMITGIPYEDVLKDFTGDRQSEGLSSFTYDVWLGYKGYAILRLYRHYTPLHADRDVWPCEPFADIHLVTVTINGHSHAVVWLKDGRVFDPLKNEVCTLADYDKIDCITGIYKVIEQQDIGSLTYLHWSDKSQKCMWCGADSSSYQYHDLCPSRNNPSIG